jgi:hypothetical protein
VQRDVVLADIRQQVAMGAEHITFGDPDFFNGPGHAMALVDAVHAEFPGLTYDVTIKIEHLLKHRDLLPRLKTTGCLFIVSAVESINARVLELLDKGHTRADFVAAVRLTREAGLTLTPTFVTFTPWTRCSKNPIRLNGPFFEETIYLTPSAIQPAIQQATEKAIGAVGLTHGPADRPHVLQRSAKIQDT